MSETVTAIYENGILRPLTPLALPESTRVQLQIIDQTPADQEQHQVRQALLDAGLIRPRAASEPVEPVSEAQLTQAAHALAAAGPLSKLIIAERNAHDPLHRKTNTGVKRRCLLQSAAQS